MAMVVGERVFLNGLDGRVYQHAMGCQGSVQTTIAGLSGIYLNTKEDLD